MDLWLEGIEQDDDLSLLSTNCFSMKEIQKDETTPMHKRNLKEVAGYTQTQDEDSIQWNESKTVRRVAEFNSPNQLLDESPPGDVRRPLVSIEKIPNQVSQAGILKDTAADFPGLVKSRKRQRREVAIREKLTEKNPNRIFTPQLHSKSDPFHGTPIPGNGSSDFDDLLKQVKTPSPESTNIPKENATSTVVSTCRSPNAAVTAKSQDTSGGFDEFNFSLDDIEAMDSLVSKATQTVSLSVSKDTLSQHSDNTVPISNFASRPPRSDPLAHGQEAYTSRNIPHANITVHPTINTNSCAAQRAAPCSTTLQHKVPSRPPIPVPAIGKSHSPLKEADPFGEFPDIDFDAMDEFIMQQTQSQPDSALAALQHDMDLLAKEQLSSTMLKTPRLHNPGFLSFSRYKVVSVSKDQIRGDFALILSVAAWKEDMLHWNPRQIHKTDADGIIRVSDEPTWPVDGLIYLKGEWSQTDALPGDIVHVCSLTGNHATDSSALPLTLSTMEAQNDMVLILHPDLLLTPTTISEAVTCNRRAVLKDRLGSSGISDKAPLFGTMRHQLFEEVLKHQHFTRKEAEMHIDLIIRQHAESLLACRASSCEATRELAQFIPTLIRFAEQYTDLKNRRSGGAMLRNQFDQPSIQFLARSVEAIEDPSISPELGLKGNIDMIVHAETIDQGRIERGLFGVELKTGHSQKTHESHMAQLLMYLLMMQTRYGTQNNSAPSGLLLYMNKEALRAVHATPALPHLKTLIGVRNAVASAQVRVSHPRGLVIVREPEGNSHLKLTNTCIPAALPEVLQSTFSCERCYSNRECMTYARARLISEESSVAREGHSELMNRFTGHLLPEDLEYFARWDRLIDLEADASRSLITETWLVPSEKREEKTGKCISRLQFDIAKSTSCTSKGGSSATLSFRRSRCSTLHSQLNFRNLSLEPGAHVVISVDRTTTCTSPRTSKARMHIVRGFVDRISTDEVEIRSSVDDLYRMIKFVGSDDSMMFRIDNDDVSCGIGTLRRNLISFLTGDTQQVDQGNQPSLMQARLKNLRDIVIRRQAPRLRHSLTSIFSPEKCGSELPPLIPGCDLMDLAVEYAELNPDQQAAAKMVMSSQDYSIIQGLPGTGKTSIITFVARLLAAHGKRVLITAYTHAAVDNVLLKLVEKGVTETNKSRPSSAVIRVGLQSSCHPGVHPILAPLAAQALECQDNELPPRVESLRRVIKSARIVGATALSIPRSPLLQGEQFDVVIVDEAGQISQPAVLGAIMASNSFVLVGDHKQLPPLVISELAAEGGFGVSLLKHLAESHPESISPLTYQYRMHKEICELSSRFIYDGKMKCGNEQVAKATLQLPGFHHINHLDLPTNAWRKSATDPSIPLVFLNTDTIVFDRQADLESSSGTARGSPIINETEAGLVRQVVDDLISCGLPPSSIGVICPFRAQLHKLQEDSVISMHCTDGLEVSTVDRYQGRDKPAIVLSFVRSNSKCKVGRLLEDLRRINVAITRAKFKLIMIGSFSTLSKGSAVLEPILKHIEQRGRVISLPSNVLTQQ